MVDDFIKYLTDEYQKEGKQFVMVKDGKIENVTDAFHSGSLKPLLFWHLDNRRFEMFQGYKRTGPIDWFAHNSRISFTLDSSLLLGARTLNIEEKNLPMSKQDLLLHISDAMKSLYESAPAGNVYLDKNKEDKFTQHLTESQQEFYEKISNQRVLNPIIEQFQQWRALYESFGIAILSDPNIQQEYKFDSDITYQLVREKLARMNGISMPSELFGQGFEPYNQKLKLYIDQSAPKADGAALSPRQPVQEVSQKNFRHGF